MKKHWRLLAFICLITIQLGVLAFMVISRETVLNQGSLIRIKTRPVDPYDIFRGRYVALQISGFSTQDLPVETRALLSPGRKYYATLTTDKDGYTVIDDMRTYQPENADYLLLTYSLDKKIINPFDRFYLNQEKAPQVEKVYFTELNNSTENYIKVRLKNGKGVIADLIIGGKSVYTWMQEME